MTPPAAYGVAQGLLPAAVTANPFFCGLIVAAFAAWVLLLIEMQHGRRPAMRSTLENGGHSELSAAALYLACLFTLGIFAVLSANADRALEHWQTDALKTLSAIILICSTIQAGLLLVRHPPDFVRIRYNWGGFGSAFQGMELSAALTHLVVAVGFGLILVAVILGPAITGAQPPAPTPTAAPPPVTTGAARATPDPSPEPTHPIDAPPSQKSPTDGPTHSPVPTDAAPTVTEKPAPTPTDTAKEAEPPEEHLGAVYFDPKQTTPLNDPRQRTPVGTTDLEAIVKRAGVGEGCLRLCGHSDSKGSDDANAALALRRAEGLRKMLLTSGRPHNSVEVCSRGKSMADPGSVDPNDRRVDIYWLRQGRCSWRDPTPAAAQG